MADPAQEREREAVGLREPEVVRRAVVRRIGVLELVLRLGVGVVDVVLPELVEQHRAERLRAGAKQEARREVVDEARGHERRDRREARGDLGVRREREGVEERLHLRGGERFRRVEQQVGARGGGDEVHGLAVGVRERELVQQQVARGGAAAERDGERLRPGRIAWNLARLPRRRSATEDFITNERRSSKAARCSGESPSSPAPRSMAAASSSASFGSRHAARREVAPPSFAAESFAPSRRSSTGAFFFAAGGTLTAGSFASWERADAQNFFHSVPFGSANVSSVVWSFATVMSP